jgi:hypothetical protein
VAVALCGLASGGAVYGTGYGQVKAALQGQEMALDFGLLKLVATTLCAVSGIPGGIFAPSLAVGAGLVPVDTLGDSASMELRDLAHLAAQGVRQLRRQRGGDVLAEGVDLARILSTAALAFS